MENKKKDVWIKPELRVFVRGSVEESVLNSCKDHWALLSGGPGIKDCKSGSWVTYACHESGST